MGHTGSGTGRSLPLWSARRRGAFGRWAVRHRHRPLSGPGHRCSLGHGPGDHRRDADLRRGKPQRHRCAPAVHRPKAGRCLPQKQHRAGNVRWRAVLHRHRQSAERSCHRRTHRPVRRRARKVSGKAGSAPGACACRRVAEGGPLRRRAAAHRLRCPGRRALCCPVCRKLAGLLQQPQRSRPQLLQPAGLLVWCRCGAHGSCVPHFRPHAPQVG